MRSHYFVAVIATLAIAGCSDSKKNPAVDAPPGNIDAPSSHDAPPAALMGLGQKCVPAMQGADCPTTANGCLVAPNAPMGFCTKLCLAQGTFMTNAQGAPGAPNPDPTAQSSMCTAIYTGSIGTATCDAFVNLMPMATNPLHPNTSYTFAAACQITCGAGSTCPAGFTCSTAMKCNPT